MTLPRAQLCVPKSYAYAGPGIQGAEGGQQAGAAAGAEYRRSCQHIQLESPLMPSRDYVLTLEWLQQGVGMRAQRKASKQERLLVQSIAAAAATMEAPARPTSQEPGKAPGKPATQKPTVSLLKASPCTTFCSLSLLIPAMIRKGLSSSLLTHAGLQIYC